MIPVFLMRNHQNKDLYYKIYLFFLLIRLKKSESRCQTTLNKDRVEWDKGTESTGKRLVTELRQQQAVQHQAHCKSMIVYEVQQGSLFC